MTTVKERPILFSGPMVRAILDGRKTQTRRVIKPQPDEVIYFVPEPTLYQFKAVPDMPGACFKDIICCPHGQPGDRLWLRESFARRLNVDPDDDPEKARHYALYRADGTRLDEPHWHSYPSRWTPSIHMPRWASRITLEITGVKVERVQDISIEDVIAEGIEEIKDGPHANEYWREETGHKFVELWNKLNGPRGFGWESNPWVWVIEFRRLEART